MSMCLKDPALPAFLLKISGQKFLSLLALPLLGEIKHRLCCLPCSSRTGWPGRSKI